jgi:outer membrane protein
MDRMKIPRSGFLLDALTTYSNVLANQSLVEAQRINVTFLRET